ncbi:DNA-directed RNA polymerase, mitochondrial isoform X2 [Copidosoma floridanum]|uniref:DNA-directed RNA polymerase, mitochondrial isoform X2 n=1 Tax=Copidosoma floridanum TaxID=29053 RepID=UPI000C6F9C14|nr:DNA-directed RNA polymerase, mitochondrial isoform X2 [Copidosoma floridanum]
MYRLLRIRGAPHWPSTNLQTCVTCNLRRQVALLPLNNFQRRCNSSMINNHTLSAKGRRKLKKITKKYAELLEVTESTSNNRKASVQKLNSQQLSLFVNQPDITLDKLHTMSNKRNVGALPKTHSSETTAMNQRPDISDTSFSEFSKVFNINVIHQDDAELFIEDLKASGITDESVIIKSASLVDNSFKSDADANLQSTVEEEISIEPNHPEETTSDKEQKAKEALIYQEKMKQFNKAVLSYVNVCVNSDVPFSQDDLFKWKKNIKYPEKVHLNDVSVFNAYMEKLALKGNLRNILKILEELRSIGIDLNVQTYTYVFDCVGRMKGNVDKKLEILKKIELEMRNDNVTLNDIVTKSIFLRDQRKYVENTVKLLNKDFQPVYDDILDTTYDCRILEKLSEDSATPSSTVGKLLSLSDLETRLHKQIKTEMEGHVTVKNISKKNSSVKNDAFWKKRLAQLEKNWEKQALLAFKRNLRSLKCEEKFTSRSRKILLHPYLSLSKPDDYISILMREVKKIGMGSETFSLPYNSLCQNLGAQVHKMYEAKIKKSNGVIDKTIEVYSQYCDWFLKRDDKLNSRTKWTLLEREANKHGVTLNFEIPVWQYNINYNIGKFLYNIITNDLTIDLRPNKMDRGRKINAISKTLRQYGVKRVFAIKPHPELVKIYQNSNPETLTFDTTLAPSICPPRPWRSIYNGGYLVTRTDIVRVSYMGNQQWDRLVNAPPRKLYPALDSLNQLGSIPWAVNTEVLDVAIKVFQDNGSVELNIPQPPWVLAFVPPPSKDASNEEKKRIFNERKELDRKKRDMYSLWCDALYRLSLANHYRDEIFWLPHNMDFRGRVYPIPPHLNHLGSDMARSMLEFALKKPLGPKGLDWLKLHCINLTGFKKKESLRERLIFANENIDKILDSAENPLTGQKWWATSDEPWQTLAACMEIAAALKSPNPEKFMSGFPIHQDGSCNGLQHYAALGRDQIGAESVNLHPCDTPQDVYSSVAAMVDERRQEDAKNPSCPYNETANVLEGFIKRKVIKQTVMTTVYGVTRYGARLQIARQLKDMDDFPDKHVWKASMYLVTKTFQTLRTMFKSAREIQDWLTECAGLVCSIRGENMEWITPLGLPVVQPYSKISSMSQKDSLRDKQVCIYRRPNALKQKNAFAPNYIHSLDSSHMMLTSIHIEHAGLTFVSVHDCYWTHPCTVEVMNKICREQFVALHSEPILDDLSKFLAEKFGYPEVELNENDGDKGTKDKSLVFVRKKMNTTLKKVPNQGAFDLNGVLSSTYFFS